MTWRIFSQIVLLMLMASALFYVVCPKYYFFPESIDYRGNKVTGRIERRNDQGKWIEFK